MTVTASSAILERLGEVPVRLGPHHRVPSTTWPVSAEERAGIEIRWPRKLEWVPAGDMVDGILLGLRRQVRVIHDDIPQPYQGIIVAGVRWRDREYVMAVDYSDQVERIVPDALNKVVVYFKLQHRLGGYGAPSVARGGYTPSYAGYYKYLRALRKRDRGGSRKRIDILARFGLRFQAELRRAAVARLLALPGVHVAGTDGLVRYSRYLREAADSHIAIDLPGNGPFCHRLPEFLGLGTLVVGVEHRAELHVPLVRGLHYAPVAADLRDIAEVCQYYLHHAPERMRIAEQGRSYFDRYLHTDQIAGYYLTTLLDRIRAAAG